MGIEELRSSLHGWVKGKEKIKILPLTVLCRTLKNKSWLFYTVKAHINSARGPLDEKNKLNAYEHL